MRTWHLKSPETRLLLLSLSSLLIYHYHIIIVVLVVIINIIIIIIIINVSYYYHHYYFRHIYLSVYVDPVLHNKVSFGHNDVANNGFQIHIQQMIFHNNAT